MKKTIGILAVIVLSMSTSHVFAESLPYEGKKVLYINSYHEGYAWSDGIVEGIQNVFNGTGIVMKQFDMDTKRNTTQEFIKDAAVKAKECIEEFQPDIIIASDDNAFQYVIMPYYRDADLPVVFCGLNWDASIYDAPYTNTTGMIEIALIDEFITLLEHYTLGDRIGYLAADVRTSRKEGEYYQKIFNLDIQEHYVRTYDEWKQVFVETQKSVDLLIVGNVAGINDFDWEDAKIFVKRNTKVPTGTLYDFMMPLSLIGFVKVSQEQGEWSAKTALRILDGEAPNSIPVVSNTQGELLINLNIAESLNIIFSPNILKNAKVIK